MEDWINVSCKYIQELIEKYRTLQPCRASIEDAVNLLNACFEMGGKLLVAGNGGSSADAEHIAGELTKGFVKPRNITDELKMVLRGIDEVRGESLAAKLQNGLPVIALGSNNCILSAIANDNGVETVFAQQILAYGKNNDVFLAISTSGNSENIIQAVIVAKALGLKTVALTGKDGGELGKLCDIVIIVNEWETYKIQELHLPIYHTICLAVEEYFFGG